MTILQAEVGESPAVLPPTCRVLSLRGLDTHSLFHASAVMGVACYVCVHKDASWMRTDPVP